MKLLQKCASVHASVNGHFASERNVVDRPTYNERRSAALAAWHQLASSASNIKDRTAWWRERFAQD
jgi:putative transposase